MKKITEEWINKAEADFATAEREIKVRKNPNYDAVCFHSQQCIEKYLKAKLQEKDVSFEKTHNLMYLFNKLMDIETNWTLLIDDFKILNLYSVSFRYPGENADKFMAKEAFKLCEVLRDEFKNSFKLENNNCF